MMSNVDPPLKASSLTLRINVEIKRVVLLLVVRFTFFLGGGNVYRVGGAYIYILIYVWTNICMRRRPPPRRTFRI